jgi:hypothetical protein
MKVLHLTLKKRWFDMIASGEKTEEYREIKPYWAARLLYKIKVPWGGYLSAWPDIVNGDYSCDGWSEFVSPNCIFEKFDAVKIRNGYTKNAPSLTFKMNEIRITTGFRDWGAEHGKKYFVIKLGERL